MKIKKIVAFIAAFAVVGFAPVPSAQAQIPVTDVLNLGQNIMTQLNTLAATVNQLTQISNQMNQIANQVKNLQNMPAGMASTLMSNFGTQSSQLTGTMSSIGGLAGNISTLSSNYNGLFPNPAGGAPLTTAQLLTQVQNWLTQSRKTYQGAYAAQARVIAALPQNSADVSSIVAQSQASQGNLDAIQAGNQLQAQTAAQLIQLNAQMAAINQAQADMLAHQAQLEANAQKTAQDDAASWAPAAAAIGTPVGQPILH